MNFTHYTLGEALSSTNETIKRNAFSILKQLQKERDTQIQELKKQSMGKYATPLEVIRNSKKIIELQKARDAQIKKPFTQIIDEWKDKDPDTGIDV